MEQYNKLQMIQRGFLGADLDAMLRNVNWSRGSRNWSSIEYYTESRLRNTAKRGAPVYVLVRMHAMIPDKGAPLTLATFNEFVSMDAIYFSLPEGQ